jgi:hypothetical protein
MEEPREKPKAYFSWYVSSVLSFIFLCSGTYMCGLTSVNPWATKMMASCGYLVFAVVTIGYAWIKLRIKLGICPTIYHSTVVKAVQ